jgi:signal transduction histidine kinase
MERRALLSDDFHALSRCLRDVVALSALSAVWSGYDAQRIAESLADVLLALLGLEFVYVYVPHPSTDSPLQIARTEEGLHVEGLALLLGSVLAPWRLAPESHPPASIAHPFGSGSVRIVTTPIGLGAEHGVVIAGARRADFATEAEALLLTVGANQAAILFGRLRAERAERQRLEHETQLAQHFAVMGRLAAGVSHELRNPLGAIFLHADLLEEEMRQPSPESAAAMAEALSEIKTQLARVDAIIQDYLSLVRVATLQKESVDLTAFVTQFAQEITPALTAQGLTLHLDALDQLGTVALHQNTFRRVLLNLVQNAMDATPQDGTITLRGRRQAATVQLDVSDTGIGIPPEHYPRIFEPLHTTKPGGTGLGLYIVQEVMAAHSGQVAVQSTVGHGTTFTITLPLAGT